MVQSIKKVARSQLAEVGANGLSLRAVSRELGMVSSAIYRYFPSRDELLTALIVDAYDAVGAAAERAAAKEVVAIQQWRAIWRAVRIWARKHPHEYALIYGSPVPGYSAPQDTITPAGRVILALLRTISFGWHGGAMRPAGKRVAQSDALRAQVVAAMTVTGVELPEDVFVRAVIALTQLFGAVSFELFGQYVGSMDPADEFFEFTVEQMADFIGLS